MIQRRPEQLSHPRQKVRLLLKMKARTTTTMTTSKGIAFLLFQPQNHCLNQVSTTASTVFLQLTEGNFAHFGLFVLFIAWMSFLPFFPAMKRVGLQNWKWNQNPVGSIYKEDRVPVDPEQSARRSLNVHATAGMGLLFVAIFQIAFTVFFHQPKARRGCCY